MNTEKNITEHNKKKKWVKPELKVLGMNRTLGGGNPTACEDTQSICFSIDGELS